MAVEPLAEMPLSPLIAALPKADLHLHQEERARLDRVVARQQGRPSYDWRRWARQLMAEVALSEPHRPGCTTEKGEGRCV